MKLAESQRYLLFAFLAYFGIQIGGRFVLIALPGGTVGSAGMILAGLLMFASTIAILVCVIRMALAYGMHPVMGVLGGLALIIPCVGLLMLLLLNQRVTAALQQAGVKVGLLGVGSAEMHKLRIGVCRGCGYDLRGLPSPTCPECGSVIQA